MACDVDRREGRRPFLNAGSGIMKFSLGHLFVLYFTNSLLIQATRAMMSRGPSGVTIGKSSNPAKTQTTPPFTSPVPLPPL